MSVSSECSRSVVLSSPTSRTLSRSVPSPDEAPVADGDGGVAVAGGGATEADGAAVAGGVGDEATGVSIGDGVAVPPQAATRRSARERPARRRSARHRGQGYGLRRSGSVRRVTSRPGTTLSGGGRPSVEDRWPRRRSPSRRRRPGSPGPPAGRAGSGRATATPATPTSRLRIAPIISDDRHAPRRGDRAHQQPARRHGAREDRRVDAHHPAAELVRARAAGSSCSRSRPSRSPPAPAIDHREQGQRERRRRARATIEPRPSAIAPSDDRPSAHGRGWNAIRQRRDRSSRRRTPPSGSRSRTRRRGGRCRRAAARAPGSSCRTSPRARRS